MAQSYSLLDELAIYLHLEYLSDLRYLSDVQKNSCAHYIHFCIETNRYSVRQWNDACTYLSNGKLETSDSSLCAREKLIAYLRKQD